VADVGPSDCVVAGHAYAASVIVLVDEQLRDEARRYNLVFACGSCTWLDRVGACALGYPNADHLDANLDESRREVIFCKTFELA
jgi:hypothetical protein